MSRPEPFSIEAPAKINWLLRVLGRRDDGFHEIETVFQTISLRDRILLEPSETFELSCDDPLIPADDSNLVARAIESLDRTVRDLPPLRVRIEKAIPSGGGLGGGSSDAAAVLRELRERYAPGLPDSQLRSIALELGSDVPFFLEGGTAYAKGRGEEIESLPDLSGIRLLLVIPAERVSTAEAYGLLGRGAFEEGSHRGAEWTRDLVARGPFESPEEFTNDFEDVIFERIPLLRDLRDRLLIEGASWARMSGSGSTIVGAFRDEEVRQRAALGMRDVRVIPVETIGPIAS
ncbi:MAG: 4-(cytidine 5'-diphospho)-2-C-methyl-D-erythritol kinase [Thermoanaerobaculia bacterium]|nr:4-(cytidine 5'-diphospho)-2-C-methyl-D-erythritol kinase [Thermoanaerobaculia bacterium]